MYKIAKENLSALFRKISETNELYLPIKSAGQTNFGVFTDDAEVDIDTLKTVKSAKDVFFPQSENLYTCTTEDKKIKITPESLQEQDFPGTLFLSEPVDSFYAARRNHGTIVALACNEPENSCFCKVFGIDGADPKGIADVAVWNTPDFLYWNSLTEKGEKLTSAVSELLEDSDSTTVDKLKENIHNIVDQLPYSDLSLDGWGGDALDEKFNSPIWEELYKPCLACGTCTFVCPTCQCYDIKDYNTGNGVVRYRCWDSCMYSDFTMMAHGNNRTSQMQRYRQRFMHKLVYYPANNDGMFSCVGCGRCDDVCPEYISYSNCVNRLAKEENET